jgi:hypothetical protein
MAGTIIADFIRSDANKISLNVGNTTFATINASGFLSNTGTTIIAANGQISGASVIASSIPTAAIADAAITNAKLVNGYPQQDYVTGDLGAVGFTTGGSTVSLGSIAIPSAGIWRIGSQLRLRWGSTAYFTKGFLSTGNAGSGEILDNASNQQHRMFHERITGVTTFGNLLVCPEWFVNMPTGLTYPYTIYLNIQPQSSDTYALNNNDGNGIPTIFAHKIAATTTSGTTISAQ